MKGIIEEKSDFSITERLEVGDAIHLPAKAGRVSCGARD